MRSIRRMLAAALAAAILSPAAAAAAPTSSPLALVRVIADISPDADPSSILSAVPGARLVRAFSLIDAFAADVPPFALDDLARADGVLHVSREALLSYEDSFAGGRNADPIFVSPDDGVYRADDPLAGDGSLIAVIDASFDVTHPAFVMPDGAHPRLTSHADVASRLNARRSRNGDFVSAKIPFAYDYAQADDDVYSTDPHGTHVAALAAASAWENYALNGAAPAAQLALMKIFNEKTNSSGETAIVSALEDAVLLGADVINLSLGSYSLSSDTYSNSRMALMIRRAAAQGVTVICAAGNSGSSALGGELANFPLADNIDYGVIAEPAILPETIAAANLTNTVEYDQCLLADDTPLRYTDVYEAENGAPLPAEALDNVTLPLVFVPGLGYEEDYGEIDVSGACAVIMRGEITFGEKAFRAEEHGARAVLLVNSEDGENVTVELGRDDITIPVAFLTWADGETLRSAAKVTFTSRTGAFPAQGELLNVTSSWGPASDLRLKPDLAAVGTMSVSAASGGGYAVMTGTSMAAPVLSGLAADAISKHRALYEETPASERAALVKAYLLSCAEPIEYQPGSILSPCMVGAGILRAVDSGVLMRPADLSDPYSCGIALGDNIDGAFTLSVSLTNAMDEETTLRLRPLLITDECTETETGVRVYGNTVPVPFTIESENDTIVTVGAGETVQVSLTLTPEEDFLAAQDRYFSNGLYLTGYVIAESMSGAHAASVPFLGFRGSWTAAPVFDAGDWDGSCSHFGVQLPAAVNGDTAWEMGVAPDGEAYSDLFGFTPGEYPYSNSLGVTLTPLRNIRDAVVEVFNEDGERVYVNTGSALPKGQLDEELITSELILWDGSDGINPLCILPDGLYTVEMTASSFADGLDVFSFPVYLDTEAPRITRAETVEGILCTAAEDGHFLYSLTVYLPNPDYNAKDPDSEKYIFCEKLRPAYDGVTHTAALAVRIPDDAPYVYIRAEDYAGNYSILRYYPENAD